MIIDSVSIGPNYRKVTVSCPGLTDPSHRPGQCIQVNGRYIAVAGVRQGQFDAVVPTSKNPLEGELMEYQFPVGPGFVGVDDPSVYFVAGGSGLGAAVSLVRHRSFLGLDTVVHLVGRRIKRADVVAAFPVLETAEFDCWDTSEWGRPLSVEMLPPQVKKSGASVFFAGPKEMFEVLKTATTDIRLNF